jgi:hypothetical protein
MKLRRIRGMGQIERAGMLRYTKYFFHKYEEYAWGKPRSKWEDDIKVCFLIRRKVGHWIYLAQSTEKRRDFVKMRMKLLGPGKARNSLIS